MLLKVTLAIKQAALNGRKSINIDLLPQLKAKGKEIMKILLNQLCISSPSHQNMWHMALNMNR